MDKIVYKIFFVFIVVTLLICELSLCSNDRVNLGSGYYFYTDRRDILGNKINGIPPTVENYWKDRHYIVVKQRPRWPPEAIYGVIDYPDGYDVDYYWVIDKTNNTVQGPLDSAAFYKYIQVKNIKCIKGNAL